MNLLNGKSFSLVPKAFISNKISSITVRHFPKKTNHLPIGQAADMINTLSLLKNLLAHGNQTNNELICMLLKYIFLPLF